MKYLFILLFCSCSVYKSSSRKNLESLGPPQGSIKTTSLKLALINPKTFDTQFTSLNLKIYDLCKVQDKAALFNAIACEEHLICIEASDQDMQMLESTQIEDPDLLIDTSDFQKKFTTNLVCKSI